MRSGDVIIEGFEAPKKVWRRDIVERGMDSVKIKIYHEAASEVKLDSSRYELKSEHKLHKAPYQLPIETEAPANAAISQRFFEAKKEGGNFEPTKNYSTITIKGLKPGSTYEIDFTISIFESN